MGQRFTDYVYMERLLLWVIHMAEKYILLPYVRWREAMLAGSKYCKYFET
jgi:hypothetical protein